MQRRLALGLGIHRRLCCEECLDDRRTRGASSQMQGCLAQAVRKRRSRSIGLED